MKKLLYVLLNVVFIYSVRAQSNNPSYLFWSDAQLNWSDFQGITPNNTDYNSSDINYGLGYRTYDKEMDDTQFSWIETYSYMDRSSSWVLPTRKTPEILLYNQVIFNIAELYSRKMQGEINSLSGSYFNIKPGLDEIFIRTKEQCSKRVSAFIASSKYGEDLSSVNEWNDKIQSELIQEHPNEFPPYTFSELGYIVTLGFGYGVLTGESKNYFTDHLNIIFGLDFQYKETLLFIRASLGYNSIKQTFLKDNNTWMNNSKSGLFIGDISIGYPLEAGDNVILTPFAGVGYLNFSEADHDYSFGKITPVFGINCDYFFYKKINFFDTPLFPDRSQLLIRTRLSAVPFDFGDDINGWTINLNVGVGLFGNSVNRL